MSSSPSPRRPKGRGHLALKKEPRYRHSPWLAQLRLDGKTQYRYFKTREDAEAWLETQFIMGNQPNPDRRCPVCGTPLKRNAPRNVMYDSKSCLVAVANAKKRGKPDPRIVREGE